MGTDETRQPPLPVSDIPEQQLTDEDRRLLDSAKELFIGSYSHSLDGKGRLVVPQPFRERLGASFCIAPGQDFHSIALYSTVAWVRLRERYAKLARFTAEIERMKASGRWTRGEMIDLFNWMIPNFNHKETGKFLDGRM